VLIADIGLPEEDGYELIRRIRGSIQTASIVSSGRSYPQRQLAPELTCPCHPEFSRQRL
jgi:CheY-like chemotaxis protein